MINLLGRLFIFGLSGKVLIRGGCLFLKYNTILVSAWGDWEECNKDCGQLRHVLGLKYSCPLSAAEVGTCDILTMVKCFYPEKKAGLIFCSKYILDYSCNRVHKICLILAQIPIALVLIRRGTE